MSSQNSTGTKLKKGQSNAQREWEKKREIYHWVIMEPQYESLKVHIMNYVERRDTLHASATYLELILKDIQRKFVNESNLATLSFKVLMEYMYKPISEKKERLPGRLEFFKNQNEHPEYYGRDCINLAFLNQSKTLYLIQAEMVTLLQKAKETLEVIYVGGSMYTPTAEIPSIYKVKRTEGENWIYFCKVVDKLSHGEHGSDKKLAQLLHDFKLLGK